MSLRKGRVVPTHTSKAASKRSVVVPSYTSATPSERSAVMSTRASKASKKSKIEKSKDNGKSSNGPSLISELVLLLLKLAFIAGFSAMVLVFLFGVDQMPNESMDPAVREGDVAVYYRLQKDYAANDLVVVNTGKEKEVRRVVAVAGDEVDFTEDGLKINGYFQNEERIYTETLPFREGITYPVTIKEGQVFVLGDNRDQSEDSRIYGPVDIETGTEGEVITIIRRRNF